MSLERRGGGSEITSEKLEYNFEEAFKNSSLSRAVLGIEIGKAAKPYTSQPAFSSIFIDDRLIPENKISSEIVIGQNLDFQTLLENRQTNVDVTNAYARFLNSDVHIRGKLFASERNFQKYVNETSNDVRSGPYFKRVLGELENGNPETIDFVRNSFGVLGYLDEVYLQLTELAKENPNALRKFEEVVDKLLNIAFDTSDTSNLRKFILRFPNASFNSATYLDVGYKSLISSYDPHKQYRRLEQLVEAVSNGEDPKFLPNYMVFTQPGISPKTGEVLDREILEGKTDRLKAVSEFHKRIHAGYDKQNQVEVAGRYSFGPFYAEKFIENQITEEQLETVASNFLHLRWNMCYVPQEIATKMFDRTNNHYDVSKLVKDPDFLSDGEIIAGLVFSGINPEKQLRDKLRGKEEDLEEIVQFGLSLMPQRVEDSVYFSERIVEWVYEYLDRTSNKKFSLQELSNNIKDTRRAMFRFCQLIDAPDGLKDSIKSYMRDFYRSDAMLEKENFAALLLNNGIFPTENLMQYMKENGDVGIDNLIRIREETAKGMLDPQNNVQRDLEFVKYLLMTRESTVVGGYDRFKSIKFVEEKEERRERNPVLDQNEQIEAEAAAFEAANLFHFIKERKDLGRKVTVIGNHRYGSYFVVEPLRYYLEKEKIPVSTHYVRSSRNSEEDLTRTFTIIKAYLEQNKFDDVIVVDGTSRAFSEGTPRLPNALAIYGERLAQDGNNITHWTPVKGEEIVVGNKKEAYNLPSDQKPQVILANPVIDSKRFPNFPKHLSNHRTGYLDDPERFASQKSEIVFTKKGLETLRSGRTQEEFVSFVQSHMGYVMEDVIRRTNQSGV